MAVLTGWLWERIASGLKVLCGSPLQPIARLKVPGGLWIWRDSEVPFHAMPRPEEKGRVARGDYGPDDGISPVPGEPS